jgi:ferrous iron transport protein B
LSEAALTHVGDGSREPLEASDVVLVGNPNVGKSALFGALTGSYVTVSNYPGTTVERIEGSAVLDGVKVRVLDTPGANSFNPSSDDERVARDVLITGRHRAVVAVGDAKNVERTLALAVQIAEMRVPFVLALNMSDEARSRGIRIDAAALASELGAAVVPTVAVAREGMDELRSALSAPRAGSIHVSYPEPIERALAELLPRLPDSSVSPRALGLLVLAGEESLDAWLREKVSPAAMQAIEASRARARTAFAQPLSFVLHAARIDEARRLAGLFTDRSSGGASKRRRFASWIEWSATHPVVGVPFLAGVLFVAYQFVGVFGAGTLVDWFENGLFNGYINPWATAAAERFVAWTWLKDLLVGPYGLLTMALTYSLALVFPIVGTFFIAFGVLEDSGYLPRLAVMVNRVFKKMGLNGKAVLPMVLGLGCDTMATLTTRILETRKERLIVILLLALGVPCSAQLTVVLTMLGALSVTAMLLWLGVVLGTILLVGALAARVIPGKGSDFVLELPPMRLPRPGNILVKTMARIEWYLKEAVPLFVLGTLILFVADRLHLLASVERAFEPILTGLLGLPRETAAAFILGFLRRDFGAAGLYTLAQEGRLDPIGVVVAVTTITLFIPCIANFFMMVKERGWKTGLAIAAFVFPFALAVGTVLNFVLRSLDVTFR